MGLKIITCFHEFSYSGEINVNEKYLIKMAEVIVHQESIGYLQEVKAWLIYSFITDIFQQVDHE